MDLQLDPDNLLVSMRKKALEELANSGQDPSSLPQGAQPYRWVTGTVCWAVGTSCMKEDRHTGIHENDLGGVDSSATASRDNDGGGSRRSHRDPAPGGRKRPAEASCSSTCPRQALCSTLGGSGPSGKRKQVADTNLDGRNHDECPNRAALGANDNTGLRAPICEDGYCELECPYCYCHYNLAKRIPMRLKALRAPDLQPMPT